MWPIEIPPLTPPPGLRAGPSMESRHPGSASLRTRRSSEATGAIPNPLPTSDGRAPPAQK
jgi:hypothetical protein